MGNFKIEIEAVGGHGTDRTAKAGELLTLTNDPAGSGGDPDSMAKAFVDMLSTKGCSIVSATLTHWPDTMPIVDDLKACKRLARDFSMTWGANGENEPILQYFGWAHLPERLQAVSKPFCHAAYSIVAMLPRNPERTVALRKLLESRDAAVRTAIAK